jgi:YD repeat-containing protein
MFRNGDLTWVYSKSVFDAATRAIVYVGDLSQDGRLLHGVFSRTLEADAKPSFLIPSGNLVQNVGLLPKSGQLASFNPRDRSLSFFDRETRQVTRSMATLRGGETSTSAVANFKFSPDGSRVAIVNYTGRGVGVFDVASGRPLYTLPEESGAIWWLAWNPNGRRLAISQADGDIAIGTLEQVERALKELATRSVPANDGEVFGLPLSISPSEGARWNGVRFQAESRSARSWKSLRHGPFEEGRSACIREGIGRELREPV